MTNLEFQRDARLHNLNTCDTVGILSGIMTTANNAPPQIQSLEIKCTFPWDDISLLLGTIP